MLPKVPIFLSKSFLFYIIYTIKMKLYKPQEFEVVHNCDIFQHAISNWDPGTMEHKYFVKTTVIEQDRYYRVFDNDSYKV